MPRARSEYRNGGPTFRAISCLILVLGLLVNRGIAQDVEKDPDVLREQVRTAWIENRERLGAVEMHLSFVHLDPSVTKKETITGKMSSGGTFITTRAPKVTRQIKATIAGEQLYYESTSEEDKKPGSQFQFDGTQWKQWQNWDDTTVLRRPDQMPGMLPLDPREQFMFDVRQPFLDVLPRCKVTRQRSKDGGVEHFEAQYEGPNRFWVRFDPKVGLLPVESILFHTDGSILRHTKMTYEPIESRNAFLVSRIESRHFSPGEAKDISTQKVGPTTTVTLDSKKLLDSPEEIELSLSVALGARFVDLTHHPKDKK